MSKVYKSSILLMLCVLLSNNGFGQLQSIAVNLSDNSPYYHPNKDSRRGINNPSQCRADTIEYARYKATGLNIVTIAENRALGQFYEAPQDIKVSGATFYAYVAANPPSPRKINVQIHLYRAGTDSLPSGSPLRSDTLEIDSTFGNGQIMSFERHATFKTPITLNYPYVIVIQADTSTLNVGVVANNWNTNDGRGEFLNCGLLSGTWFRGRNLNVGGIAFDSDMLLLPHVEYLLGNDFEIKTNCYNLADSIKFENKHRNNVSGSKMYNRYAYFNLENICHRWNYGNNGSVFSSVNGATKYTSKANYEITMASTIYYWRGSTTCIDTTKKTVFFQPDNVLLSGAGIKCKGDSTTLLAFSPNSSPIFWVQTSNNNDTTPYLSNASQNINPITESKFYYARAKNNMCWGPVSGTALTANDFPQIPSIKNDSVCSGSRANLTANANNASIEWFRDSTTSQIFYTGNLFQTSILTKDTIYFVRANNQGCINLNRVKIQALVGQDFAPSEPLVSNDTIVCLSSNPSITLEAQSSQTLRWYTVASGGTPIHSGSTLLVTPTAIGNYEYFVEAWNGVCGSTRNKITIQVDNAPQPSSILMDTICMGENAILKISIPYGKVTWYDKISGNQVSSDSIIFLLNLKSDSTLYAQTSSQNCISNNYITATAKVNSAPALNFLKSDTICSRGLATFKTSVDYGNIHWYENEEDQTPIASGNTFTTPPLLGSKSYFINTSFAGCNSGKIEIKPLVNARPFAGFYFDVLLNRNVKFTPLTLSGTSYLWNFGNGQTSIIQSPTHQYSSYGTFNVSLITTSTTNQCKDTTQSVIELGDPMGIQEIVVANLFEIYPNPSNQYFTIKAKQNIENEMIKIYSLSGKMVWEEKISLDKYETLKVEHNLSNGLYILQIGTFVTKIQVHEF